MPMSKRYLVIINAHNSKGDNLNSYKTVLRGGNEESLRKGLSGFLRREIESNSDSNLKKRLDLLSSEEVENEINKCIEKWELRPSSGSLYRKEYIYEPEPGSPNPSMKYTQVKNIIRFPMLETEYDMEVKEVTDYPRLSSCREVIVMSTDTEEGFRLEYPEIIYIKDADEEKDEEIIYSNGYYETICKTSSEMEEYLLCWKRDVMKVEECR